MGGTFYLVAAWRMGARKEHIMELVAVEWVHGKNILSGCSLANGCVGGTCYRVEDWRIDVWTEFFAKL